MQAVRLPGCPPSIATQPPPGSSRTPHPGAKGIGLLDGTLQSALQHKLRGDVGVHGGPEQLGVKRFWLLPRAAGSHGSARALARALEGTTPYTQVRGAALMSSTDRLEPNC